MTGNLLSQSTSPYLLQHKDNPVHWRPWGPEALAEARATDRPILLSVGYAACHWCHVMAHESFENPDIAALMNDLYVNVKVDREERPDIDAIYMAALHMLGEQGGWPMTMFLTPDGEPFWGGTYFPPEPRWGRPSFPAVLREIARLYADERAMVDNNSAALRTRLSRLTEPAPGDPLTAADTDATADALLPAMDPVNGGIRGAPKFPNCGVFELLLRSGVRRRDERFVDAVVFALERICEGGIYDHLGGGFARYAVDARWLVPHFEKMLYDNAQLIDVLTTAWQLTRRPLFAARIAETIDWAAREMRLDGGGFASSLDADSEGEEGRFYVWSADEIHSLLGNADYPAFAAAYGVSGEGNWEGKVILNRLDREAPFTLTSEQRLTPLRARLLEARSARVRPGCDDKVLADWNGLMISALARAGAVFARPDWLGLARDAFRFITESMADDDLLKHAARRGAANIAGMASDYANMALAAASLFEVTGEAGYRESARQWIDVLEQRFAAESGGYHMSPVTADDLIVRPLSAADEATPNANAVALEALVKLNCFTGNNYDDAIARTLAAFAAAARDQPFSHARLLAAADTADLAMEIVVAGPEAATEPLWHAAWRTAAPAATRSRVAASTDLDAAHPARAGATPEPAAYVCARRTCSLPLADPARLAAEIEARRADAHP